jgi:uncharacterized protein YbcV (DUF1398 family)
MNTKAIHEVVTKTPEGKMTFPQVVVALMHEGVESYFVDFAAGTHSEPMILEANAIAEEFSDSGLVAAIRGAQADTIRYPEFVKRSTAAGVIAYWAFLTGKKVVYLGRKGEMHVEEFPRVKSWGRRVPTVTESEQRQRRLGWRAVYIPPIAKCAMDGAPGR